MRVLFVAFEGRSHLYPSVPLAWSFYAAGHDVRVACPPVLVDAVVEAGLPPLSAGEDFDMASVVKADQDQLKFTQDASYDQVLVEARRAMKIVIGFNNAMAGELIAFARKWRPDLVIWDPGAFAGMMAARSVGAPDARLLWGPDLFMHRRQNFEKMARERPGGKAEYPLVDWFNEMYDRFDLGKLGPGDLMGRWTIDQVPPSMRLPVTCDRLAMRYIPYNGSARVSPELLEQPAKPRVFLTPGITSIRLRGEDTLPVAAALDALGSLDIEVIVGLTPQHRGLFPDPPPNARLVESVSLHMMLPTCSAIVHQGGAGTTLTAAANAVPQLIIPNLVDQPVNAAQLASTGAGLALPGSQADAATIREHVLRLLEDPAYAKAAVALRDENARQPSPPEVVRKLEELVDHPSVSQKE